MRTTMSEGFYIPFGVMCAVSRVTEMNGYPRIVVMFLLHSLIQHPTSSQNWDAKDCSVGCATCFVDLCLNCKPGYHGVDCSRTCSTNCQSGVCEDNVCLSDCVNGWYGDMCQNRCLYCSAGCERTFGSCNNIAKPDDDGDGDYKSTKMSNKFETAIKVCASIVCIAVILFVVATFCRRRESSSNDAGDADADSDNDVNSDYSRVLQVRPNRNELSTNMDQTYEDRRHSHGTRTADTDVEMGSYAPVLEEPIIGQSGEYQVSPSLVPRSVPSSVTSPTPSAPPAAQPAAPPPVRPPVPMEELPPSYESLFPGSENRNSYVS